MQFESINAICHYGMTKWDDLAKSNEDAISELRNTVKKKKKQKKYD